jgi:UDP-N-acetylmuramate dehydrogenase
MLEIKEYVDISEHSTLKIGGQFRYFTEVHDISELTSIYLFAKEKNVPIFILGGGSNIVFSDGVINVLAVKMKILGFSAQGGSASGGENHEYVDIKAGAGENWDKFVEKTVEMNLAGLESLSAIPGTVGATPVQNVGAYGAEVKDTIVSVEVFDTRDNTIKNLSNADCKFSYRDSIFKNEAKGRYVILSVTYRLKNFAPVLFKEGGKGGGNLKQRRQEIIETRWKKLPHPEETPNVGSFFKNPFVKKEIAEKILKDYPDAKFFPVDENTTKVPAGWLIENAGLKGKSFGNVSVYEKNALVLVNNGEATKEDLMIAKNEIVKIVFEKFGITLEQEPEIV